MSKILCGTALGEKIQISTGRHGLVPSRCVQWHLSGNALLVDTPCKMNISIEDDFEELV